MPVPVVLEGVGLAVAFVGVTSVGVVFGGVASVGVALRGVASVGAALGSVAFVGVELRGVASVGVALGSVPSVAVALRGVASVGVAPSHNVFILLLWRMGAPRAETVRYTTSERIVKSCIKLYFVLNVSGKEGGVECYLDRGNGENTAKRPEG